GKKIGGAAVSQKHANFIVNCGNAKSADVLRLMRLIKNRVKRKFKVDLEPEIRIWR
ncbi:MAG: UDP-N-acetylenolpyruvoylglucosamine reductase, partial [Candidatus Omnitrophica bacterium]|nr:UDP-N-acetylenolpyruvoylglucosamine reductase [Candidatus Omnitrophota bacterium]